MSTIFDVAKYILDTIGEVSTMKLQKLCYYSQAWHLVWTKKPLFGNAFFRWENGPVCKELFAIHKGSFYIASIPNDLSQEGLTLNQKETVDKILEFYGKYDGAQLSELTHREKPWLETKPNDEITKDSIQEYYSSLIQ